MVNSTLTTSSPKKEEVAAERETLAQLEARRWAEHLVTRASQPQTYFGTHDGCLFSSAKEAREANA